VPRFVPATKTWTFASGWFVTSSTTCPLIVPPACADKAAGAASMISNAIDLNNFSMNSSPRDTGLFGTGATDPFLSNGRSINRTTALYRDPPC
jgi:hypothetical protein